MSARPFSKYACIVGVLRGESLRKLTVVKTTISAFVVSVEEEVYIVESHMYTNVLEAVLHIKSSHCAQVVDVKDTESVKSVEVRLCNSFIFGHFNLLGKGYLLSKHMQNSLLSLLANWHLETWSATRNVRCVGSPSC